MDESKLTTFEKAVQQARVAADSMPDVQVEYFGGRSVTFKWRGVFETYFLGNSGRVEMVDCSDRYTLPPRLKDTIRHTILAI